MKAMCITDLLIVGALLIFSPGFSSKVYKAFTNKLNYTEAHEACRSGGNQSYLAKIGNPEQLTQAKDVLKNSPYRTYWTGLHVERTKWGWSDGKPLRDGSKFYEIIGKNADYIQDVLSQVVAPYKYCFLVTDIEQLTVKNCSEKHAYMCEGFQAELSTRLAESKSMTTQIRPTPLISEVTSTVTGLTESKSMPTQIRPTSMTTPFTSEVTATVSDDVADASTIMASKTLSTSTQMSTSISPTQPASAEKQIKTYLVKMKKLSVEDEDSLQIAVNETSLLMTRFRDGSHHKTTANVLIAAEQLEKFSLRYAKKHLMTNGTSTSTTTNIGKHFVMEIQNVKVGYKKEVTFPSEDDRELLAADRKEKIILPTELFRKQEIVVVGIIYKDMHKLLPDESQYFLDGENLKNTKLQTRVVACSIFPIPPGLLPQNVTISFTLEEPARVEDTPHCVFWDFNVKSRFNGSWSNRGCSLVNKTNNKIVCSCNHLTNFAVLMQVGETNIAAKHVLALEVITYIGCGLSLVGETLTILTYLVFMNLKQEQCQIRLNLVIAIAVAQIIFLAGIDATSKQEACIFVALSIHYFYLVGFAWMLMEGIYLYLMVVQVFNTLVKMKLFYAFSWGFPCLMVVCSIVIASGTEDGVMSYVHSDFCWVSFSNNLVWTFAAPVLVVCLVNLVILCRVVCEMTKMQPTKDISNVKQGLKACAVLFPLLGTTWVFGILSVTDAGLVFQYIFTILNSLQGFFIFVIHVLRSSDVRNAYHRKKQKWEDGKNSNFPSSRSVVENSSAWLENHAMSNLRTESPDPMVRRHQVSPIDSDRMDTRESCLTPVN